MVDSFAKSVYSAVVVVVLSSKLLGVHLLWVEMWIEGGPGGD